MLNLSSIVTNIQRHTTAFLYISRAYNTSWQFSHYEKIFPFKYLLFIFFINHDWSKYWWLWWLGCRSAAGSCQGHWPLLDVTNCYVLLHNLNYLHVPLTFISIVDKLYVEFIRVQLFGSEVHEFYLTNHYLNYIINWSNHSLSLEHFNVHDNN